MVGYKAAGWLATSPDSDVGQALVFDYRRCSAADMAPTQKLSGTGAKL
jgi:hypothetical protein